MATLKRGGLKAEGKTKRVWEVNSTTVDLEAKDDITAGDGAKHDVIVGKAELATRTTCNVFRLLEACGVPVSFRNQSTPSSFLAEACEMILYEVVARREGHGSYLKRAPHLAKGQLFPKLLVEFFLKTTGKKWLCKDGTTLDLPCDDPFIKFVGGKAQLFVPNRPIAGQEPFATLADFPFSDHMQAGADGADNVFVKMDRLTRQTFLVLEKAWQLLGRRLVDFKIEFGLTIGGRLLVADVIDNDSWRVVHEGQYEDKQVYRDGGDLNEVTLKYQRVADLTDRFALPQQQVVLWRGSTKDDWGKMKDALAEFVGPDLIVDEVTESVHKQAIDAILRFQRIAQRAPDSVALTFIGRSNGAGPILDAAGSVPVVAVPADYKESPHNVWSHLSMPSGMSLMVVLDPVNAVSAAIKILAARNPRLYMLQRYALEERLTNVVEI